MTIYRIDFRKRISTKTIPNKIQYMKCTPIEIIFSKTRFSTESIHVNAIGKIMIQQKTFAEKHISTRSIKYNSSSDEIVFNELHFYKVQFHQNQFQESLKNKTRNAKCHRTLQSYRQAGRSMERATAT